MKVLKYIILVVAMMVVKPACGHLHLHIEHEHTGGAAHALTSTCHCECHQQEQEPCSEKFEQQHDRVSFNDSTTQQTPSVVFEFKPQTKILADKPAPQIIGHLASIQTVQLLI